MSERRERAERETAEFQYRVSTATDRELATMLTDQENAKIAASAFLTIGVSALVSSIATAATTENDWVKNLTIPSTASATLISGTSMIYLTEAKLKAQSIIAEAKKRSLKVIPGHNRSIDLPETR